MRERLCLQIAVAIASLVPISAGLAGAVCGAAFPGWLDDATFTGSALDSHMRYLSGLLLGIGLAFAASVSRIERHTARFNVLTAIVVIGGIARLGGLIAGVVPQRGMLFALAMELLVTPLLWAWQRRVAARNPPNL